MALNPMKLMKLKERLSLFKAEHQKAIPFMRRLRDSGLEEGTILELSAEKTLITDVRKRYVQFLGFEYKVVPGKSRKGYIPRTIPNRARLERKVEEIKKSVWFG